MEALELEKIQQEKNLVFAVTYTYAGYPMVRQMTTMISNGTIGKIQKVDAQYLQGWLNPVIHEKEKRNSTWRLDPEKSGISCCVGDIGTHASPYLSFSKIFFSFNFFVFNFFNLIDICTVNIPKPINA